MELEVNEQVEVDNMKCYYSHVNAMQYARQKMLKYAKLLEDYGDVNSPKFGSQPHVCGGGKSKIEQWTLEKVSSEIEWKKEKEIVKKIDEIFGITKGFEVLSELERKILYNYYFLNYRDIDISREQHWKSSSASYRKRENAIKKMAKGRKNDNN